jgi:hypothetical protein
MPLPTALDAGFMLAALLAMQLARRFMPLYALLVLPGTALHELAHWLVGKVLAAQPTRPDLLPRRGPAGRWRLGSVAFRRLRGYNALPVALAPLLLLPAAWLLYRWGIAHPAGEALRWLALYGAVAALVCCLPSRADIGLAASRPLGTALWIASTVLVVVLLSMR